MHYNYAITCYPNNTSDWTSKCFDLYFCITFLSLSTLSFLLHCWNHYLSIIHWPFATSNMSWPLVFLLLIDHSCPKHFILSSIWHFFPLLFSHTDLPMFVNLPFMLFLHPSVLLPRMRNDSTCRRLGSSTLGNLSMSSVMAHWCCKTWVKAQLPPRALCFLELLMAWLVGIYTHTHTHKQICYGRLTPALLNSMLFCLFFMGFETFYLFLFTNSLSWGQIQHLLVLLFVS